jgi:hypothetical protein
MPEVNTGGVGLLDFDGDGWMDVFASMVASQILRGPGHRDIGCIETLAVGDLRM